MLNLATDGERTRRCIVDHSFSARHTDHKQEAPSNNKNNKQPKNNPSLNQQLSDQERNAIPIAMIAITTSSTNITTPPLSTRTLHTSAAIALCLVTMMHQAQGFALVGVSTPLASSSSSSLASTIEDRQTGYDTVASAYQDLAFLSSLSSPSPSKEEQHVQQSYNTLAEITSSSHYGVAVDVDLNSVATRRNIQSILSPSEEGPTLQNNRKDIKSATRERKNKTTSTTAKKSISYSVIDEIKITDDDVHINEFGFVSKTSTDTDHQQLKKNTGLEYPKHIQYPGYRDVMFEYYSKTDDTTVPKVAPHEKEEHSKEEGGRYLSSVEAAQLFMDMFYTQGSKVVPLNDHANGDSKAKVDGIIIDDENDPSSLSSAFQ